MIRHFKPKEFSCRCCGASEMQNSTIMMLDSARETAKIPFILTSAYRCYEHNKDVGASKTSSHTNGYAVDIAADNSSERFTILISLINAGFTRIGIAEDFIHVDNDPKKPANMVWLY